MSENTNDKSKTGGAGSTSQFSGWAFVNDALRVLEGTPDIGLDWNEEMQDRAKEGIVSAIKILGDGMKLVGGESHKGDPCEKCGVPHDEVAIGRCSPNVMNEPEEKQGE